MNIYEKLIAIQNELKSPKSEFNSFGKYNFRSLESILENLKPILLKHKCVIMLKNDLEEFSGRLFRKSTVVFQDCESESNIQVHTYTQESLDKKGMSSEQCSGSTSSYGDKYCLGKLFLIDDTKDADATNTHGKADVNAPDVNLKKRYLAALKLKFPEKIPADKIKEAQTMSKDQMNKEIKSIQQEFSDVEF